MKRAAATAAANLGAAAGLAALLVAGSCTETPIVLPSRDLDRPTDMAFACVSAMKTEAGAVVITGQPMGKCHPSQADDPPLPAPGSGITTTPVYRTYSFVPNADRGDLSVVDMSYCRADDKDCQPPGATLVDLDPTSVGFAAVPVGELPEAIVASQDGCRVVTANRGSCDLTLIDPAVLLTRHLDATGEIETPPPVRDAVSVVPVMASGRLAVAPGEIAFVPQQTALLAALGDDALVCDPAAPGTLAPPVGDAVVDGQRVPWRVVVTFPSCDLVALMELPSGLILDSYQVTGDANPTLVHSGANPVCAATDCPFVPGKAPIKGDGGDVSDGGTAGSAEAGVSAPASRPGTFGISALAMHPEGKRIYFGGTNNPAIFVLDIAGQVFAPPVGASASVATLSERAGGAVRMRLSVDPYDYSKGHDAGDPARPEYGRFVAGRHDNQPDDPLEFLYVAAKDGSLRVMDVAQPLPVECDLNIDPTDPLALATPADPTDASDPFRKACFVYKAPGGPRRLFGAGIPGRRFPGAVQDIAFANYRSPPTSTPSSPTVDEQQLSGAFAFVMTNAGAVHIVNIDPELRPTRQVVKDANGVIHFQVGSDTVEHDAATDVREWPRPLTHSPRDFNVITFTTSLGTQVGPPRVDIPPSTIVDGPQLMKFVTSESRVDPRNVPGRTLPMTNTYVYFPNRATVHAQTWRLQWEGDITGVRVTGDIVDPDAGGEMIVTTFTDNGAGFCALGGGDGDIMTLVGCDTDAGCPVGSSCVRGEQVAPTADGRAIQGMCLPRSMTDHSACERMLKSFRRYEIVSAPNASTTTIVPRRSEIHRPAYTDSMGVRRTCDPTVKKSPECGLSTDPVLQGYECRELLVRPDGSPLRDATVTPEGRVIEADPRSRCLRPCADDRDCRAGRVCVEYPGQPETNNKFCAEGGPIVQGCGLDQLVSYKLSAGSAFLVTGSVSGRTEAFKPIPTANGPICVRDPSVPTQVARIPMNTPTCDADVTPAISPEGKWPADFLGTDAGPNFPRPDPCLVFHRPTAVEGNLTPAEVVSAIFQNNELRFVLTDLQRGFRDNSAIQFTVNGGSSSQTVFTSSDALPGLPARILLGPVASVPYATACPAGPCMGDGRFSDLPYLYIVDQRGFSGGRLGARGQVLRIIPRISTTLPYPGFESFTSSGRYFPIQ